MLTFEEILKFCEPVLFKAIRKEFKAERLHINKNNYILVEGKAPILLVAHLDTVHQKTVKDICYSSDKKVIMSPQGIGGDDRCGVYALLEIWKRFIKKPFLLFTCGEEVGGIGAEAFAEDFTRGILPAGLKELKYIIEIDRKGKNDAVFYDCDNSEFEDFIEQYGFKFEWGSFSDISVIAPALGIAAVNLSSGYYNAHTAHEYIKMDELENTIKQVIAMVAAADTAPRFDYVEYIDGWEEYDKDNIKEELLNYYTDEELRLYEAAYGGNFLERMYDEVYY